MDVKMATSWKEKLNQEFDKPYFVELAGFVKAEYATRTIYPLAKDIFNAFECCSFESTRVVILGQDPYHGAGQANGLCFSVNDGIKPPPSLVNIFKEVKADLQTPIPSSGNLIRWAQQGVLLLNATLTVRDSSPASHQNRGWEVFTDAAIQLISQKKENVVFLLWGAYAQKKGEIIDRSKHCVLTAPHPSPFSANRGFLGCRHFSMANAYLKQKGFSPINW
jgi:uracil-DNA glycosylase